MRFIIDTHTFLWIVSDQKKLGSKAKKEYLTKDNERYFSTASIWEMAIKINLGKLTIKDPLDLFIEYQTKINDIKILDIECDHIYKLENLPLHHRDPFDRMIIAQGMSEGLKVLSSDIAFDTYPIERIW